MKFSNGFRIVFAIIGTGSESSTVLESLIRQRVYGIALGYEDLNDHDRRSCSLGEKGGLAILFWGGNFSGFWPKPPKKGTWKWLIAPKNFGAGDGDRTRDVQLGKLAFYR